MEGPSVSPRSRRLILLGGVLILSILVIAAAVWFHAPLRTSYLLLKARAALPAELKTATFIAERDGRTVAYPGFTGEEVVAGTLVSVAGTARITRDEAGTFAIEMDGEQVLSGTAPRVQLARSPDGTRIAFVEAVSPELYVAPGGASHAVLDRKGWNVKVYDRATRTTANLGLGGIPVFTDDTHLAWIAPAGLVITDLSTWTSQVVIANPEAGTSLARLVSPNGSLMAWYTDQHHVQVVDVTAPGATLRVLVPVPERSLSVTLGDDALYAVVYRAGELTVVKQPFTESAESTVIATLPAGLKVSRLLLGIL